MTAWPYTPEGGGHAGIYGSQEMLAGTPVRQAEKCWTMLSSGSFGKCLYAFPMDFQ
ncbi:hypothetical protein [Nonomuraea sp. NPDC001023]|uniref:hypothetical protein n=1 Tax=unclassified Nonomuraea TaxID=2593643 RepID=UPI00332411A8